jgi:hypothetical protein
MSDCVMLCWLQAACITCRFKLDNYKLPLKTKKSQGFSQKTCADLDFFECSGILYRSELVDNTPLA